MLKMNEHKWIEISMDNLLYNILFLKSHLNRDVLFCSVIKANAYGHGIINVARTIIDHSDFFAVHEISEAKMLIRAGLNRIPILLLGPVVRKDMPLAIRNDLHFTVYGEDTIMQLNIAAKNINKQANIHLKIDTGTSRQGILPNELDAFLSTIQKSENINFCGLSMHFANIEDTLDHTFAFKQLELFRSIKARVKEFGFSVKYIHSACTAAALLFPETHFSMVRSGIGLYGLWPSRETFISHRERGSCAGQLKPVLSLKTRIVQIKEIAENSPVGYGCSFITTRKTKIGVLPVGYADGYLRAFGNRASVIVRGKFAKVIGRVCMNLCMIDITDIENIQVNDPVILIGSDNDKNISAENLAVIAGTINYEIVALLNSSLKRYLV